jgi:hypothetical protein
LTVYCAWSNILGGSSGIIIFFLGCLELLSTETYDILPAPVSELTAEWDVRYAEDLQKRLVFTSPSEVEIFEDAANEGCDI